MSDYICPHCKNPVYDDDALLCHFCGESLRRAGNGVFGPMKYTWRFRGVIIAAVIAVFLFVFFLFYG